MTIPARNIRRLSIESVGSRPQFEHYFCGTLLRIDITVLIKIYNNVR